MALMDNDWTTVFSKVGMEPSGDPFNSIMKLETNDTKKPSNPMINAGAIVTTSLIKGSSLEEKEERMLQFFRRLANNDSIGINYEVYKSEKLTGDRNRDCLSRSVLHSTELCLLSYSSLRRHLL